MREELNGNIITYTTISIGDDNCVHADVTIETEWSIEDYTFSGETLMGLQASVIVACLNQDQSRHFEQLKQERENAHE